MIGDLTTRGIGVVFISHHLDEVLAISDRITVLRDGSVGGGPRRPAPDKEMLIGRIVGAGRGSRAPRARVEGSGHSMRSAAWLPSGAQRDRRHLVRTRRGEIVGLTGLTGAGARELAATLAGVERGNGDMMLDGAAYAPQSVRDAIARGVVFVPEDMRGRGLVMPLPISSNLTLSRLGAVAFAGWLRFEAKRSMATGLIGQLNIAPPNPDREVGFLSGEINGRR